MYTTRPLSDRTWLRPTSARVASPFSAQWPDTLELLTREVQHLRGSHLVIEVDVLERAIRQDGMLRADTRVACPAVVVAFDSRHGPMLYRSDRYAGAWGRPDSQAWRDNVRAVALTLQSLRAVDRYGATDTGQQYAGFKAIGGGSADATPMPATMTTDAAYDTLGHLLGINVATTDLTDAQLVRRARGVTHPDRNEGDRTGWDLVERAARVLGVTA